MNKKPKLYIKLPNGRYAPYVEPKAEYDNVLYRKRNGRYVPWGMDMRSNEIDEGVWVVSKSRGCKSYASVNAIHDSYRCIKCGDIVEAPTLAELGGYEKLCHHLLANWSRVDQTCVDTIIHSVVGILMEYRKENNQNETKK